MKLSFSIAGKSSAKANSKSSQKFNGDAEDPSAKADKEFVTEFDPSKTAQKSKKLVIPPKQNEWRPLKKMKNLELPLAASADHDLQFEVETAVAADGGPNISYGLNIRNPDEASKTTEPEKRPSRPPPVETVMLQKLKEDLKKLPDGPGLDDYAEMPIEGFGAALLAGYGWQEGMGIGKNTKKDVKVVEYKKWVGKEGLGFFSEPPSNNNNSNGNGSIQKEKEKSSSRGGEEQGKFSVGKDFRIIGGKHIGLKGRIVDAENGGDTVVLKLSRSDEEVNIRIRDLAELGSVEEEKCLKRLKELKTQDSTSKAEARGSDGDRSKDSLSRQSHRESRRDRVEDKRKESKRNKEEGRRSEQREDRSSSQVSWLASHIRVRIISKDLKKGRLYLKKGEIVDVVGPTTCDITMDDSRELIQGVAQELLETALPRRGGPVLVLYGKHKGVYGNLMEKDMDAETGLIRDADSHELISVRLEQIAEYIGDPSYLGY